MLSFVIVASLSLLASGHVQVPGCGQRYLRRHQDTLLEQRAPPTSTPGSESSSTSDLLDSSTWSTLSSLDDDSLPLHDYDSNSESNTTSDVQPDLNIIGGRDALRDEFPFMASLQVRHDMGGRTAHKCGATVLNEWWLLTAAHCIFQLTAQDYVVQVGSTKLNDVSSGRYFNLSRIVRHRGFRFPSLRDDIALLKTAEPMPLTYESGINAACLPPSFTEHHGQAQIIGFGRQHQFDPYPSLHLKKANVTIVGDVPCRVGLRIRITGNMLCATTLFGFRDTCAGDSGGPMIQWQDGRAVVVGITSWGRGWCGMPLNPGVYTQVSRYMPWILTHAFVTSSDIEEPANGGSNGKTPDEPIPIESSASTPSSDQGTTLSKEDAIRQAHQEALAQMQAQGQAKPPKVSPDLLTEF